ncbi:MAG: WecB/TagA/CpsF family glycosyltransferase [Bacteroidales bacterium]|nr:WecB/TagA/CpsF family glycosyltransferase [Bacteroidales bacterium]
MHLHNFLVKLKTSSKGYPESTFGGKHRAYTCVNAFSYHIVRRNLETYNKLDGIFVDGIFMCKMLNWFWRLPIPRLSFDMTGIAPDLFSTLEKDGRSIYFIGAKPDEIRLSVENISSSYPAMKIAGYRDGYFKDSADRSRVIKELITQNPDFLIVGMGSPLQEKFAIDVREAGYQGTVFTCGGFLHQSSASIQYYPDWINKYNLRAFYRLYREKGMFRRLFNVLIQFPALFTYDTVRSYFSTRKQIEATKK